MKRWLVGLVAILILVAPVVAQDETQPLPQDEAAAEDTDLVLTDDSAPPVEEDPAPTPIVIVVTATPEPTPIGIDVTATPEPTTIPEPPVVPAATSTAEPRPASRVDGLQGETGAFCKGGIRFSLRVVSANEVRRDVIGMVVEATNLGARSEDVFRMFDLRDQRSRSFDMAGAADYAQYSDDLRPLRGEGVVSSVTNIQPGRTELVYTAFLVAPDSTSFRLIQRRPPCA